MAKKNQGGQLPGGMAGLTTYYDEYEEPFQIDPKVLIGLILSVVAFEIFLHL